MDQRKVHCLQYQSVSKHCCLVDCFEKVKDLKELKTISNLSWCFTPKHEEKLREFIVDVYEWDHMAYIIKKFLDDDNYKAFIRPSLSLLNGKPSNIENTICPIWYSHHSVDHQNANKTGVQCVVAGPRAVGKSSLIMRFIADKFGEEMPRTKEYNPKFHKTIPINVDREDIDKYNVDDESKYKDRQKIAFEVVDTAGLNYFGCDEVRQIFLFENAVVLLVFDVMDNHSFLEAQHFYKRILWTANPVWNEKHDQTNLGIVVVGNKCDLREAVDDTNDYESHHREKERVDMNKVNQWLKKKQLPYIEVSAKTGQNVNFLFRQSVYEYWIQSHSGCQPDYQSDSEYEPMFPRQKKN